MTVGDEILARGIPCCGEEALEGAIRQESEVVTGHRIERKVLSTGHMPGPGEHSGLQPAIERRRSGLAVRELGIAEPSLDPVGLSHDLRPGPAGETAGGWGARGVGAHR